jgi:hypothetical protein
MRAWRDVDEQEEEAWFRIVDRIYREGITNPGLCPSCGRGELRFFYWRFYDPAQSPRGGMWIWCPACLRFQHSSGTVPAWWQNLPNVDYDCLLPEPEWLEEHWAEVLAAGHPQARAPSND